MHCFILIASIFLCSQTNTIKLPNIHWDTQHFVEYTSDVIVDIGLAFTCIISAMEITENIENRESYIRHVLPAIVTATAVYLGYKKYTYNKLHNYKSHFKRLCNYYVDLFLIISIGSAHLLHEHQSLTIACMLAYIGKYMYFNRPQAPYRKYLIC